MEYSPGKHSGMSKREADTVEQIVRSMNEREYWGLVNWLANACERPLWHCVRPPTKKQRQEWARQREADRARVKAAEQRGEFVKAAEQAALATRTLVVR